MTDQVIQDIHLIEELTTTVNLIEIGFGEFQNINSENNFYFLPFQLLSSGFERLMKCHICLGYHEQNAKYPDFKYLKESGGKNNGHDLVELKAKIVSDFFQTKNIPALVEDYDFLVNDNDLNCLIDLLSEFGKFARYYNFDVVTSSSKPSKDVKSLWDSYVMKSIQSNPDLAHKLGNIESQNEVIQTVYREIIIRFERFVRAISRQFTIGQLGVKARQYSPTLYPFIMMSDEHLGNTDYRNRTTRYKTKTEKVHQRIILDEAERKFNNKYKNKLIRKIDYDGDWLFYHDEIIVECRENHWCVVTINGNDYALNGAAKARYKLEDVFEGGMAILGKSIQPFIDIAKEL
jgi:hypothetical protein